ncbi:MAG: hypothetical protein K9J75_00565 [Cyanobium usitatum Tobar12.5m-G36]|nr:hypothetical protein [Cyanobium usitatum Tobar12.5m-G36]
MGRSTALEWVSRLADTTNQPTPANLRASSDAGQLLALLDGIGEVLQRSGQLVALVLELLECGGCGLIGGGAAALEISKPGR